MARQIQWRGTAGKLIRRAWRSVWWRQTLSLDLRSVALFRIGLGGLALADILQRAEDLQAHYTDWGLLPRGPLVLQFMHYAAACVHLMTGTSTGMALLFILHGCVALALIVGWRSRLMAALLWFLTYGLHLRNPMVLQGGDDLLRMLFFWGMFLPLGARFSIDAGLHREVTTCSIEPGGMHSAPQTPSSLLNWPTVALIGQLVLMYACTTLFKTGAPWHNEATAVYNALNYDQLAKPLGIWLRQFTWLLPYLTHATFWTESAAPFLLLMPLGFGPVRTVTCFLLAAMHHAFAACLVLGLFPWIDMVALLALLPPWFWHKLSQQVDWRRQDDVVIFYDDECTFCKKMVQIIKQFLVLPKVAAKPAQTNAAVNTTMQREHSWVVEQGGTQHTSWTAFAVLAAASPLLWPFAQLLVRPPLAQLGHRIYQAVASRRGALSQLSRSLWPWAPVPQKTAWPAQMVCGLTFCLVLAWNIQTLNGPAWAVPEPLHTWALALRFDQCWSMFSPFPATDDGWFVIDGKLDDGTAWDVWWDKPGPASFEKPAVVSQSMPNQRWSKYMMNIWQTSNAPHRLHLARYICLKYNHGRARHPKALGEFEIVYVREDTLPHGVIGTPQRVSLWRHHCW